MKFKNINKIKTQGEARDIAISWQLSEERENDSWEDVSDAYNYFTELASKFNLTEEFHENGII